MAKDGPVNGVTEILEAIGRQDSSAAMERIKATGRSISGSAGYMRNVVNSLRDQYQASPNENTASAYAAGTSQLNQVLAYRDSLKGAANYVNGGGLNRADGNVSGVVESLTKGAAAAAQALQQFQTTAQAATQGIAQLGQVTRNGGTPNGPPPPAGMGPPNNGSGNNLPPGAVNGGAGAGGRGGGGGLNTARGVQTTANVLGSVTDTLENFFVKYPVEQKRLAAEYANRANDQYNIAIGAASGDAMSILLKNGKSFENASLFADNIGDKAVGLGIAGTGINMVGGLAGSAGALLRGNVSGAIQGGVDSVMGGVNRSGELAMGLTRGRAEMQAYDADMSLSRATKYVDADLLQKQIDYQKNLADNTYTMGGIREAFIATSGSQQFLKEMQASHGMSPTEFAQIAGGVSGATGSTATVNGFKGFMSNVAAVRDIERSGLGTRGESIGRMGAMANAGANNSGEALAAAIGQAVANGFDNSKAVGQIVESTAAVAERGGFSALGIDSTDQISSLVGQLMKQQGTANQFQAAAGANQQIAKTDKTITDTSVSLNNAMRFAQMNDVMGGPAEAIAAMKLSSADLAVLQKGGSAAKKLAVAKGLGGSLLGEDGKVNQDKVSAIVNVDRTFEAAGGAGFGGRMIAGSLGVSEEQKQEALDLAEKMGGLANVRDRRPDLAKAVDALMLQGNVNVGGSALITGQRRGTQRATYKPRGGASVTADTLRDAPGRTEAAQVGASAGQVDAGRVATTVNDNVNSLTAESLKAMATAAKTSADAMGINNAKLKELTDALDRLNANLKVKAIRERVNRARNESGQQTKENE